MAKGNYNWNQVAAPTFSGSNASMSRVSSSFDKVAEAAEKGLSYFSEMEAARLGLAAKEHKYVRDTQLTEIGQRQTEADEYVDNFFREKKAELDRLPITPAEKQSAWNKIITDFRNSDPNAQRFLQARGKEEGFDQIHSAYQRSFANLSNPGVLATGMAPIEGTEGGATPTTTPTDTPTEGAAGASGSPVGNILGNPSGVSAINQLALMHSPIPDPVVPQQEASQNNYGNILHSPDGVERFAEVPEGGTVRDAREVSINKSTGRNTALGYFQIQLHQMPTERMKEVQKEFGISDDDPWNYETQEKIAKAIFMENARAGKNMGNIFLGLSQKDEEGNPTGEPIPAIREKFPKLKSLDAKTIIRSTHGKEGYMGLREDDRLKKFFEEITPELIASEGGPAALQQAEQLKAEAQAPSAQELSERTAQEILEASDQVARMSIENVDPTTFVRNHRLGLSIIDQAISQKNAYAIPNYNQLARSNKSRTDVIADMKTNPVFENVDTDVLLDLVDIVQSRLGEKGKRENYAVVAEIINRSASNNFFNTTRGGWLNKLYGSGGVKDELVNNAIDEIVDGYVSIDNIELQELQDVRTAIEYYGEQAARHIQNRDKAKENLETYSKQLGIPIEVLQKEPAFDQFMRNSNNSINLYKNALEKAYNMESPNASSTKKFNVNQEAQTEVGVGGEGIEAANANVGSPSRPNSYMSDFNLAGARIGPQGGRIPPTPTTQQAPTIEDLRPSRAGDSESRGPVAPKQRALDVERLLNNESTKNEVMNTFRGISESEYDDAVASLLRKDRRRELSFRTTRETIDALIKQIEESVEG